MRSSNPVRFHMALVIAGLLLAMVSVVAWPVMIVIGDLHAHWWKAMPTMSYAMAWLATFWVMVITVAQSLGKALIIAVADD